MRSRTVFAGLTVATLAFGVARAEDPTPPELKAVQEKATPGDQFTDTEAGAINGTVKGATGNVLTLDVGRKEPLVQVVVKDEDTVPLEQLQEGTRVRTSFRNEGGIRVATSIEVLEPVRGAPRESPREQQGTGQDVVPRGNGQER
ncbi:hypothetical protein [Archangium sp.]|uniref:hypothetical protein n=1 Tax=Archangium sp. TaxID=1872627 RepID=UPI002D256388|nr:hypothetical protein [Archangium sp.]HYO58814.1 hypothetical protein [Archangium sp.]